MKTVAWHFMGVSQLDRTCKVDPVARLTLTKSKAALEGLVTTLLDKINLPISVYHVRI